MSDNREIDIRIAKHLGWISDREGNGWGLKPPTFKRALSYWATNEESAWAQQTPHYSTDIHLALGLIAGMTYTLSSEKRDGKIVYTCWIRDDGFKAGVEDNSLPLAITYCWNKLQDVKAHG